MAKRTNSSTAPRQKTGPNSPTQPVSPKTGVRNGMRAVAPARSVEDVAFAIHDHQLAEHGGPEGVRDAGALESALARPRNLAAYERPDAAALAAAYAYGLARNHPFADGNKRTAWVVARVFLAINGLSP